MVSVTLKFESDTMDDVNRQMREWAEGVIIGVVLEEAPPAFRSYADVPVPNPMTGGSLPYNPGAVPYIIPSTGCEVGSTAYPQVDLLDDIETEGDVPTELSINAEDAVVEAAKRYGKKYGTRQLRKLLKVYGGERARELPEDQWVPFINATARCDA